MEYNTKRDKLMFYDYGRNVYKMIVQAKKIEDRDARNAAARNIIKAMSIVNPAVKETTCYERKLWDHLMIWSNFELDVDSPYETSRSANMQFKPRKLHYKDSKIRYRHYGKLMESMVKKAVTMPQGDERSYMVALIANQMKKDYMEFNHDSVPMDVLGKQFEELSGGNLSLPEGVELGEHPGAATQGAAGGRKYYKKKKKKK